MGPLRPTLIYGNYSAPGSTALLSKTILSALP